MKVTLDMTLLRFLSLSLLSLLLVAGLQPVVCSAMDPSFELDPAQVQQTTVRNDNSKKNVRKTSRRAVRSHRRAIALHKSSVDKEQPGSVLQLAVAGSDTIPGQQQIRAFWETLVPTGSSALQPLTFKSEAFDLAIDPARYPQLKAVDGGILLLDAGGTLPPLVRTLIQEKDPGIRIITASPADGRRFLGELLSSGGFYSVEEQPVMSFGSDPRLSVRSDFKVERSSESVMNNEVMLISAARQGLPPRLTSYLKEHGVKLLEPFAGQAVSPVPLRHRVVRTVFHDQRQVVDLLLETLSQSADRNKRVELFKAAETGIGLSVAAERYFERNGRRYVVASFTGDPITYTLFRLLETKGYRVVILEPNDSFKTVASKLLSRMDLPSTYSMHQLMADHGGQYSFEMSGFMLENAATDGGSVMLTDRPIEPAMRELLYDHGYQVQE